MNKMTKGALGAGLGVALLLGGSGTLAVWNADQAGAAGTIVSGDLNLDGAPGTWTSNLSGAVADITAYKVVPGEVLTYTQPLEVTLDGDELTAKLTTTGAGVNNGFKPENVAVSGPVLTSASGTVLPTTVLDESSPSDITATITFSFLSSTSGRDGVNASYDFSQVGFLLEQQAPVAG